MTLQTLETKLSALEIEREETETALADIRSQIDRSAASFHETGVGGSASWYASARAALRYKGADHQNILREIAKVRGEIKAARHLAQKKERPMSAYFVDIAREQLSPDVFEDIFEAACLTRDGG